MSDPFIGELRPFSFSFAPFSWLPCDGRRVNLRDYPALYAVIGGLYGPTDGNTYFTLPDFRKKTLMQATDTPLPGWVDPSVPNVGKTGGQDSIYTNWPTLPSHTHTASFAQAPVSTPMSSSPTATSLPFRPYAGGTKAGYFAWSTDDPGTNQPTMSQSTIGVYGSATPTPHDNCQPYLPITICIAADGVFPTRD